MILLIENITNKVLATYSECACSPETPNAHSMLFDGEIPKGSGTLFYDNGTLLFIETIDNVYLLSKINTDYENAVSQLISSVPNSEISTWTKQESEARSWLVDNTVSTPLIDAICLARQVEKAYLVNKIIEKADAYATAIGALVGERQKQEKLIKGEISL